MSDSVLQRRLEIIWKPADFKKFFTEHATHPPYKLRKGTILFNENEPLQKIYFIDSGFIKLYRLSAEGRDTTIYLYGPGDILGLRALTSEDETAKHTAESLTDVTIRVLFRQKYLEILANEPSSIVDLMHSFINRLNYTEQKLERFIISDTTARVANFLADCLARFGKKGDENNILPLPLTHQQIAGFIGAYRETVSVAIEKLEKEKVISTKKGIITIINMKRLKQIALLIN